MRTRRSWFLAPLLLGIALSGFSKEFLTPKEIEKIQDALELDKKIKVFLDAAELRLKVAEERLRGQESAEGDPLELFSVEEMLDGYYRILRSVMFTLDEAFERRPDPERLPKALKGLKDRTEKDAKSLDILKKIAEDKKLEEVWNLVNKAREIADGARDGAETGLTRFAKRKEKK